MNDNKYKEFHRNYKNINELYDDLKDKIYDINIINNKININYKEDICEISLTYPYFNIYINKKKYLTNIEDQDIYYFALDFVHEKQKNLKELIISDIQIINITKDGIYYDDEYNRIHFIDFSICNKNYNQKKNINSNSIGERNIKNFSFYFHYYNTNVVIKMYGLYRFKTKKRILYGKKQTRFLTLQKLINEYGYTTLDIS